MSKLQVRNTDATDRIIKAARKLFFAHGVNEVSTNMLAKEANVSKATMYDRFPNMEAILATVVEEENKRFFDPEFVIPATKKAYRQAILDYGINLLTLINQFDLLRFDQLMLSQVIRSPHITSLFYKRGYEANYAHTEKIIAHGQKQGFIKRKEPADLLADMLINCWEGRTYQRALYGIKGSNHKNIEKHCSTVMKIILEI